jgi:hypothetical protein
MVVLAVAFLDVVLIPGKRNWLLSRLVRDLDGGFISVMIVMSVEIVVVEEREEFRSGGGQWDWGLLWRFWTEA